MTKSVKVQSIEDLYNDFMLAHGKNKPVDANERDVLSALVAGIDFAKTKMIVTKPFKAGTTLHQIGEVYPATENDRANVIRLCRSGYILPEGEYNRALEYQANKSKAELVKHLFRDLQNARDNKTTTARKIDEVRLELSTVEGAHGEAVQELARIESEILKELS